LVLFCILIAVQSLGILVRHVGIHIQSKIACLEVAEIKILGLNIRYRTY
jgi:hypothetical protein